MPGNALALDTAVGSIGDRQFRRIAAYIQPNRDQDARDQRL
jgi:hypothetical protein